MRISYDLGVGVAAGTIGAGEGAREELVWPRGNVIVPRHQAHGVKSVIVRSVDDEALTQDTDALITRVPGLSIGVKTADCVPILLHDPVSRTVAAVHSGWKGTLADIIGHTVDRMTCECEATAATMRAVIGPCIHVGAFEVGDELFERFAAGGYASFCHQLPRPLPSTDRNSPWEGSQTDLEHVQWHIDLPGICREQLLRAGISCIQVRPECTFSLPHLFYSARRLGPAFTSQRNISFIRLQTLAQ